MSSCATLRSLTGMGDAQTTGEVVTGVTTAGTAIAAAASAGLLGAIGITASAVPIIGPIVSVVAALLSAFHVGAGCGQSCTLSTQVVEQVIPVMQQNLAAALQLAQQNGGCIASADKAACLKNFDDLWNAIVQGCRQVGGPGGSQCVSDRQRGGKYDAFKDLRDPINALPVCVNPPASEMTTIQAWAGSSGLSGLLLPLALIAAGFLFSR